MLNEMWKTLLGCFCVSLFIVDATAREVKVHFRSFSDKEMAVVDAQGLPQAREIKFTVISIPAPYKMLSTEKIKQSVSKISGRAGTPKIATVVDPSNFGGYLRSVPELGAARELLNKQLFDYLEDDLKDDFKSEFGVRVQDRNRMLPEADWIDQEANEHLGPWKEQLDSALADLNQEFEQYALEINAHNAKCAPAPNQEIYEWCLGDHRRLDSWKDAIRKKNSAYTAEQQKFIPLVRAYNNRAKTLSDNIQGWLDKLGDFVERLKNALNDVIGSCTEKQRGELQDKVNAFCKVNRSCKDQKLTCAELNARLALNVACAAARDDINNACYGGGNQTHQDEARRARESAIKCKLRISQECGSGIGVSGALDYGD
jgi:hypothetical protein